MSATTPGLLIIEDDWIVAQGLREMLRAAGFRVVGVAARRERVDELVKEQSPTLALVDIDLGRDGDGIELARTVLEPAGVQVVFTSAHADEATLVRAREAHPAGFIVKPFTQRQLRAAVEMALAAASRPRSATSPEVDEQLASVRRAVADLAAAIGASTPAPQVSLRLRSESALASLTDREHDVLRGLLEHRRVPSIAEHLGISAHTVRNHLKAIFGKLGVASQQELLDLVIDRSCPTEDVAAPKASTRPRAPG